MVSRFNSPKCIRSFYKSLKNAKNAPKIDVKLPKCQTPRFNPELSTP